MASVFDTSFDSDSDSELWGSFESSTEPPSSSPTLLSSSPSPDQNAKRPLKRKLESFVIPLAKKPKVPVKITFTTAALVLDDPGPFVIAGFQSTTDQRNFTSIAGLPTGVVWEIARLVSMGRLTSVSLEDLDQLRGLKQGRSANDSGGHSKGKGARHQFRCRLCSRKEVAGASSTVFLEHHSQFYVVQYPWEELDLEETAIRVNPNAALGNTPENPKVYGGKVSFVGTIEEVSRNGSKKVVLERCTLTSSCRLCRRFGSSSILRLKVPLKLLHSLDNGLRKFFQKPFVIFGSVFRSFYAKEGTVFLFKTREHYRDGVIHDSTAGLSLFEFLDQFNPLQLNADQALCKWASRFALGLSNSVPGPVLDPADVDEIDDIISPSPEQSNMTDGCGISNLAFNLKLRFDFGLETTPCAVQVRHGGKKGILLLCPNWTQDPTPRVAFRKPSQVKIEYSEEAKAHPANATVDILRFSRTTCPARISPEVIINLEHNGVPADVFVRMQDTYIAQGVENLLFWAKEPGRDTPEFMLQLWIAVEKSESVYVARRVREAAGQARFRGFGERFNDNGQEDEEEDELFDSAVHERSTAWWPDYISGSPSSLAETCMTLIDSGFTPQSLPVLRDKLKQIVLKKIKYRANRFKYEVVQSASAFVVPDIWNVLEENEIQFKSSKREFTNTDGLETDTVIGDILMTRNPCKVPTDVRKFKAIKHPQLHDLVDVIVCSVKGKRRLLDFLAGGDYDGDTAIVIWDQTIVDSFVNAPEKFSKEPRGIEFCFTRDERTVADFNAANPRKPPEAKAAELQRYLLGSLQDPSAVGQYSGFHDNSILINGYNSPKTVKLAYQFCKILDAPKTGYELKQVTRNADAKVFGHARGPAWKNRNKEAAGIAMNTLCLERKVDTKNPKVSRPFIMDVLNTAATSQEAGWKRDAEAFFRLFEEREVILDPHLAKPWDDFEDFARRRGLDGDNKPNKDLAIIGKHVEDMYRRHSKARLGQSKNCSFTDRTIEYRQDTLRALSRDFAASPSPEQMFTLFDPVEIARLRASYAYVYDHKECQRYKLANSAWSRFPWDVALRDLCKIKVDALGPHKAVTINFYERFKLGGDRR
ncbi:Dimethylaniline monooxygenase [Mycena venus]|uniref:RNA-dependent RNA polymerase n=1 Tax=Mycena venus TaxID=2733690 RepID=A0A8H6Y297_9AGAR|nr:Dimethylaniline monooxygenase [Mycena venus]